jgi:hypothetical protein
VFTETLETFMQDFGVPVLYGSQRTTALYDSPDMQILSQRAQTTGYRIEYPATDLSGLKHGDELVIGTSPGWKFDAAGDMVFVGPSPELAVTGQFRVLGTPNMLDNGAFIEAQLERIA